MRQKKVSQTYNLFGILNKKKGEFAKSLEFLEKSKLLKAELNDSKGLGAVISNIGAVHQAQGKYDKALESYFLSLEIAEEIDFKQLVGNNLNNIGTVYWYLENYEKELEYYQKSLEIKKELDDKFGIARTTSNIGETLIRLQKYDDALACFENNLKLREELEDKNGIIITYQYIGSIYQKQEKYDEALSNYLTSLEKAENIDSKAIAAGVYQNIGELYLELKQYDKAIQFFNSGLNKGIQTGSLEPTVDSYKGLSDVYQGLGDYQKAHNFHLLYATYKDSLYNETSSRQIAEMRTKYETESKEKEIAIQGLELARQQVEIEGQRNMRNLLVIFFIVIAVIVVLLFNRYKLKKRNEQSELSRKNIDIEHRMLRAQMNPHFIFNSLNSIQYFVSRNDSYRAERYLSDFGSLMRSILENSSKSEVTLEDEVRFLKLYLTLEQLRSDHKFEFEIIIADDLDLEFLAIPPMLIQPYLENSIVHGIMNKEGKGKITIEIVKEGGIISCSLMDDGIGRKRAMEIKNQKSTAHKSIGMQVTKDRLDLLNRQMKTDINVSVIDLIDNNDQSCGTKVELGIPVMELV